jgi:hypothetical protein
MPMQKDTLTSLSSEGLSFGRLQIHQLGMQIRVQFMLCFLSELSDSERLNVDRLYGRLCFTIARKTAGIDAS